MMMRASEIKGFVFEARDGEFGRVKDFYFDDLRWTVRYLVADTGKWLSLRQVLLSPHSVRGVNKDKNTVVVELTRQQIESSPTIEQDLPVSRQFEEQYYRYYNYPFYWQGAEMWGPLTRPATNYGEVTAPPWVEPQQGQAPESAGDPHLRSTNGVTGYHVRAADGEIGHIEDFVLNDEDWAIAYLVVDTVNWWPGKKVLVPPSWASKVSWRESNVVLDLDRATIKGAPGYEASTEITREYESKLFSYYNRDPYWSRKAA